MKTAKSVLFILSIAEPMPTVPRLPFARLIPVMGRFICRFLVTVNSERSCVEILCSAAHQNEAHACQRIILVHQTIA
ncbi:hypothetical protein [Collimonas pratensis]|uniref:hypothetical protein n=1 Tax=Collimonas pratensis TaxID=279113 RepID=UPI0012373629|nr:hypothetical protein [Collimonas pratensis]